MRQIPFAPFARPGGPACADHRRRRRQRDPGVVDLRGQPHRRRRVEPAHRRPAARQVQGVLRRDRRPSRRQLCPGRRAHLPRPQQAGLRPDLVRRSRQLRGVEQRHVGCVRPLRELPLHVGDDRRVVRPSHRPWRRGRPVRRPAPRDPAGTHGPLRGDVARRARRQGRRCHRPRRGDRQLGRPRRLRPDQHHDAVPLTGRRGHGRQHRGRRRQGAQRRPANARRRPCTCRARSTTAGSWRHSPEAATKRSPRSSTTIPVEITAIDDNRPFFWHFTKFTDAINVVGRAARATTRSPSANGCSSFSSPSLPSSPASSSGCRSSPPVAAPAPDRCPAEVGCSCTSPASGLGFMMIEISMIQRFALLLGYPTLSLSVSLFTLLIATAVGARLSAVLSRWGDRALPAVAALLIVLSTTYMADGRRRSPTPPWPGSSGRGSPSSSCCCSPSACSSACSSPPAWTPSSRPPTTRALDRGRVVAWCWAVNGFFSVLGATLTTITSMAFGFNRALQFGLVLYVVAVVMMGLLRRVRTTGEEPVEPAREPATVCSRRHALALSPPGC